MRCESDTRIQAGTYAFSDQSVIIGIRQLLVVIHHILEFHGYIHRSLLIPLSYQMELER